MKENGGSVPALENMPTPIPSVVWYLDQFKTLQRDRRYEQGTRLPIGNDQIKAYYDMWGLEDFEDFHSAMVRIDNTYLTVHTKREEAKKKREETKSKLSANKVRKR